MTTAVDTVPDWAAGYAMDIPCIWKDCPNEIAWWGNQHGCTKGHCCDFHMREFLAYLNGDMSRHGYIRCRRCGGAFHSVSIFLTAVRI